jgi:3-hydroxy-3-methylglutaryl CoA synthase/uncharacterized OB-fold protein
VASSTPGLKTCGAYLPRPRIERVTIAAATAWARGRAGTSPGRRSFCNWDEDSVTMGVEAARACLDGVDRARLGWVGLASTTFPFADRSNAGLVAAALGLQEHCATYDFASTRRAGVAALIAALERTDDGLDALVVAADRRIARPGSSQETGYGHGAAGALVGRGPGIVAERVSHASVAGDFVDQYRETGEDFDYVLEDRWIRDEGHLKFLPHAIELALERAGVEGGRVAHLVVPTAARTAQAIARNCGLPDRSVVADRFDVCGDTGSAHPLLLLAACLENASPGELIMLTGFGQGADAVLLRVTETPRAGKRGHVDSVIGGGAVDGDYLRFLAHCGVVEMDWGKRAERDNRTAQSVAWRRHRDVVAFVGGRCRRCNTVQYPRTRACVNPDCRAFDTQDEQPLADGRGRVKTWTEDWLAYTRDPPLVYGNVALEGGGNLFAEFTDTRPGDLAVGTHVRFVFRVKDIDVARGFRRYFWKAVVVE